MLYFDKTQLNSRVYLNRDVIRFRLRYFIASGFNLKILGHMISIIVRYREI
jgi:hypothetical protein